jgi:predicted alpha/beta hydrolase
MEPVKGELKMESLMIPIDSIDSIHLKHICIDKEGPPIFMLHGAVENGKICYSDSGRAGLGPYLARYGYDVYVGDLRGRGGSTPHVNADSKYGQTEAITEDIPAFIEKIISLRGNVPQRFVCHSWGGVLTSSTLVRFPKYRELVKSMVYLGAKRRISVFNMDRLFQINHVYCRLGRALVKEHGYFPSSQFGLGDDESAGMSHGTDTWIWAKKWIDTTDGFDYGDAAKKVHLPPTLYIAAIDDACLGHRKDVWDFMMESGDHVKDFMVLSKKNGNLHDYNHVSMMTHRDAPMDHFPKVLEWLGRY